MRISIFWKLFLSLITVAILGIGTIGFFGFLTEIHKIEELNDKQYLEEVRERISDLEDFLSGSREDVNFLANSPFLKQLIAARSKTSYQSNLKRLESLFYSFLDTKRKYFEVRYLDEKGNEIAGAYCRDKTPKIIPKNKLANKANRYYFTETMKKKAGETYVSNLDLMRINEKIHIPPVLNVRYGAPVFDQEGSLKGIIVVNLLMDKILRSPAFIPRLKNSNIFLVDQRGYYYLNQRDKTKEFGAPEDLNSGENLKKDFPQSADKILSGKTGLVYTKDQVIFYVPFHPYDQSESYWVLGYAVPKNIVLAPLKTFAVFYTAVAAGVLIFAFFLSSFMARKVTGPIEQLKKAAEAALNRDYDQCIRYSRVKTGDEIENLGQAIAATTQKIKEDIEELKKVDRMKSEFMSMVSHEMRTPLTSILGFLELLEQGVFGELLDTQKESVLKIKKQALHLLDLISSILDITRIEFGQKFEIQKGPISIVRAISEVAEGMKPEFDGKEIELVLRIAPDLPTLAGDEAKIKRMITNVLGNALKFTPKKGVVEVNASATEKEVIIKISDTGIGIPKDKLEKIFDKFFQVDSSLTREYGGIGMGLTIARQIAEAHGGSIRAESEGPGRGSTFVITLPILGKDHSVLGTQQ
jgi:signal transduction histidine kinase